jgi:hypothetical protein
VADKSKRNGDDTSQLEGAIPGHLFGNYKASTSLPTVGPTSEEPGEPNKPAPTKSTKSVGQGSKMRWPFITLVIAAACWLYSLLTINTSAMNEVGLVDVFPIAYFVGLGLVVVGFIGELLGKRSSTSMLIAHLVLLVLMVHATIPIIFPEPHYAWTYKHFGVTSHLDEAGVVEPSVDIYQNWPGFFAFTSFLDQAGGISSPVSYGGWAQPFFNLVYLLQLGFIFRSLTTNRRVVWLGLLLFVCTSWVAQDYFAPQAFAFALVLGLYGIIVRWLAEPAAVNRLSRIANKLLPVGSRKATDVVAQHSNVAQRQWAVIGACFLFFVVSASHQLTPFMVIAGVGLVTLFGFVRQWSVVFLLAAVAFFYLLPHLPFVIERYGIFSGFDPLSNAQNSNVSGDRGDAGRLWVADMARLLSAIVFGLAFAGFIRRLYNGHRELMAALLMIGPAVVLVGQSYGGEAIYRVYFLALPFAVYLAAQAIAPAGNNKMFLRAFRPLVPIGACVALLMPAYFGLEHVNEMRPGEVAASQYFYNNAPPNSVLMTATPNFPTKVSGNYDEFQLPSGGDIVPDIASDPDYDPDTLTEPALQEFLEQTLTELPDGGKYLVLSRSQEVYGRAYGTVPPGVLQELDAALGESDQWRQFYRNSDAVLYEYLPALEAE